MAKTLLRNFTAVLMICLVALVTALVMVPDAPAAPEPVAEELPAPATADVLPTPQINGVAWKQVIVGNTVYVGGEFTTARPFGAAAGVNTVPRSNMLAYNLTTGELNTSFAPTFNGKVSDMAVTPDGSKLVVVGTFTEVNGQTRNRAAVFNMPSATLSSTVVPDINGVATSVAASNTAFYFGGWFSAINNVARARVGAVSASNGSLLPFVVPVDDFQLSSIVVSPDASQVVLGGNFTSVGGSSAAATGGGRGLYRADATTGAGIPLPVNTKVYSYGSNAGFTRLASDETSFYGTGWNYNGTGNTEGTFQASWSDGDLVTLEDCHGDSYDVFPRNGVVYNASHKHYCGNTGGVIPQTEPNWTVWHATAWTKAARGTNTADIHGYPDSPGTPRPELLPFLPQFVPGNFTGQWQATWTVTGNDDYVLYGGEFLGVDGRAQQGLVRFGKRSVSPTKVGPRTQENNGFSPTVRSLASGEVRVSWPALWDKDGNKLTYQLYRDTSAPSGKIHEVTKTNVWQWNAEALSFTDKGLTPGTSVRYAVRVIDADGNLQNSGWTSTTVAGSDQLDTYGKAVLEDGASKYWRLDDTTSTVNDVAGPDAPTAGAGVTRGTAGALLNSDNAASTFAASSTGRITSKAPVSGPNTYSTEIWFRTSTTAGGKILGFGDSPTGNSSKYDRTLYLDTSGRVNFAVRQTASTRVTLQSGSGLNNNQWHQAVATLGLDGMVLYVDGKQVASRPDVTNGLPLGGQWRLGADSTFSGATTFNGSLDEFSLYPTQLTKKQVDAHWVASGRSSTLPVRPADTLGRALFDSEPDLYWRLDGSSGSTAEDLGTGSNAGTYRTPVTRNVAGATSGNSGIRLTSTTAGGVTGNTAWTNPQTFSQEVWIKTGTTGGGRILGFGSSNTTTRSGSYDRALHMLNDGRVRFGVYNNAEYTIDSSRALNDNKWHQVVTTFGRDGMKLYVDGQLDASGTNATAQNYNGYWRVGGDNVWAGSTNRYYTGDVDEAAVYSRVLSDSDVRRHFLAGGGSVPNAAPVASFTSTSDDLAASFDASASSDSDGTVQSYSWSFGDGKTGTGKTVDHRYAKAGTYTVELQVTDDAGDTHTLSKDVVITHVNVKPTAAYTFSTDKLKVSFDASGSTDSDGTISSYAWDFGDGTTGTGATATRTYDVDGAYRVRLTVTDDAGESHSVAKDVIASAGVPLASDGFGRSTTNGWGSADVGGAWTISGTASRASVSGGVGQFLMPAGLTQSAYLSSVSTTSSRIATEFSVDKVYAGSGEGQYVALVGRKVGSDEYKARLVVQADGSVRMFLLRNWNTLATPITVPNLTIEPGAKYKLSMQTSGTSPTTVSAKVWKSTSAEPTAWQMTGTDTFAALQAPGSIGLFSYLPGGTSNAPITTSFYGFSAVRD